MFGCEMRGQNVVATLPFPTRSGRSGLNRLRERWLALCLIAQLVREGDWLTRRTRDVVRSAGVPWGRTAGHWRRFPHRRPLGSRTLPPVRSRMSMTISRRCSASSGPLSAVMPLRRSHRATVARGTNPQAESGRGVALDSGAKCWDRRCVGCGRDPKKRSLPGCDGETTTRFPPPFRRSPPA